MSGFFIPSYLDKSDGPANFQALADSFTRNGPIRFKSVSGYYTAVPEDTDVVLRCDSTTEITVPVDVFGEDNFRVGAQIAVLNYSEKRVVIEPAKGVTINGPERLSVDRWRWGVLVKQNANLWLLSLGNLGGGDAKGVPLPPKITACFGISAGASIVWSAPVDDGGSPITQYIIEQSLDEKDWEGCGLTKPDELNLTVDDLKVGTKYFFRVKAVNANGISDPSNVGEAVPTNVYNEATGGEVSTYTKGGRTYRVHTFKQDATFVVTRSVTPFECLVVAGGGGGCIGVSGGWNGSGGGAGGLLYNKAQTLSVSQFPIQVGKGGSGSNDPGSRANQGGSSSLSNILVATGGGGGGTQTGGGDGGSGGGSSYAAGGKGIPGQGNNGVSAGGRDDPSYGGGAGGTPTGRSIDITGTAVTYARGGWGAPSGYGNGGNADYASGQPGSAGVVIIAYETAPYNEAEGGAVSTYTKDGKKYKVHTFTDNSTLIVKSAAYPFRILCVGAGAGRSGGNPSCCGGPGCERGPYRGGGGNHYLNDNDSLAVQSYPVAVGVGGGRGNDGCCDAGSCGCCPGGGGYAGGSGGPSSIAGKVGAGGTGNRQFEEPRNYFVTTDITGTNAQYGDNGGGDQGGRGIVIVSYEIDPNVTEYDEGQVPEELPIVDTVVYPDGNTWRLQGSEYVHEPSADIAEAEAIVKEAKKRVRSK